MDLLKEIHNYFGVGNIYKHGSLSIQFRVQKIQDLRVIINHFDKFPLITQKRADYELFKQAFLLIEKKEHLTEDGLRKIIALKASLNKGLTDNLKSAFPQIIPVTRPLVQNLPIPDPQ
jgi:hypothetical protein